MERKQTFQAILRKTNENVNDRNNATLNFRLPINDIT